MSEMTAESFRKLVQSSRSVRRFSGPMLEGETISHLIGCARLCPSAANRQPYKFTGVIGAEACSRVYPSLRWAGYLNGSDSLHPRWDGPSEDERPRGYVVIWHDTRVGARNETDLGIVAQTICLAARASGLGACMIGAFDKEGVTAAVPTGEMGLEPALVIALGEPAENPIVESCAESDDADIRYWRDEDGQTHVPKRDVEVKMA